MNYRWFLLMFSLIIIASQSIQAQDTLLQEQIDPVEVVATRIPTSIWQTARSVRKVDLLSTNMGNFNMALDEALQYLPGVFGLNPYNFAQDMRLSIRGFGSRAAFGVRGIKVMLDDIPATTPDGQTQMDHLDMQEVSSLEVINGAAAGLYGNASGGLISLQTRVPDKSGIRLGMRAGSFGFLRTHVDAVKKTDNLMLEGGVTYQQIDGYRAHSGSKNLNLRAKLTKTWSDASLKLIFNYLDSPQADDPGGIDLQQVEADRRSARDRNVLFAAGEEISRGTAGLVYKRNLTTNQALEWKAFYIFRDFQNYLPFEDGGAVEFFRNFTGTSFKYRLENKSYRLLAGIDLERQADDRSRSNNLMGSSGALVFQQLEVFTTLAPYLLQEFTLSNRVKADLTARADFLSVRAEDRFLGDGNQSGDIQWQHLSPSAGINYRVSSSGYLFGRYAHSFETPALSELSNSPDGSGGFNQDLKPQIADHYELGFKGWLKDVWRYHISLFHIDLQDELLPYEVEGFPGRTFFRNAGTSDRNGVEFSLSGQLTSALLVRAAYTFSDFSFADYELDGESLEDNILPGIPRHFSSAGILYAPAKGWYGSLDGRYNGGIWVDDRNTFQDDAYIVVHSRMGWRFNWAQTSWDIHLGVRNLTSSEYPDNIRINAFGGRYFEPAPTRHFFFGTEINI